MRDLKTPRLQLDQDLTKILGRPSQGRRLHIVCVGAHPDDPETGCGGTLAKFASAGHRVSIIYLTRGEAGVKDGDRLRTSCVRTAEALNACDVLGAEAVFANQIDGQTSASPEERRRFAELLSSLLPDVVFTHWPHDTHVDHRNAALLTEAAWEGSGRFFSLVYYEVMTGIQTQNFQPNYLVDVSANVDQKRRAIYKHVCQNPDRFYPYHVTMEKTRAAAAGLVRAEGFVVAHDNLSHQDALFASESCCSNLAAELYRNSNQDGGRLGHERTSSL